MVHTLCTLQCMHSHKRFRYEHATAAPPPQVLATGPGRTPRPPHHAVHSASGPSGPRWILYLLHEYVAPLYVLLNGGLARALDPQ
jgi:hypothetical protein